MISYNIASMQLKYQSLANKCLLVLLFITGQLAKTNDAQEIYNLHLNALVTRYGGSDSVDEQTLRHCTTYLMLSQVEQQ